jgi:hypothetical protein
VYQHPTQGAHGHAGQRAVGGGDVGQSIHLHLLEVRPSNSLHRRKTEPFQKERVNERQLRFTVIPKYKVIHIYI